MSARVFDLWRRPREQELPGVEAVESHDEEDPYRQLPLCPAFSRGHDPVLLLPCSHPMCAHCIAAAEGAGSGRSSGRPRGRRACLVPCQYCRRPVELPCRTWSSATSCLPKHPDPSLSCVSRETDRTGGQSEDQSQHVQAISHCRDAGDTTEPGRLHGSDAASSSGAPVGGDVDLREEEMERSVSGLRFALDASNVPPSLVLSNFSLTVTYQGESQGARRSTTCDPLPQVSANVVIARGQYYWEVDVCNSSVYRIGCSFGGRFYSLEDTWHPDLGEPFGVMHCVQCHCETVSLVTLYTFIYVCTVCHKSSVCILMSDSMSSSQDPDFAEVLTDLNSRELFWLSRGQLEIAVATEGQDPRQISGFITGRKSCDTIQSVMSSGEALTPGKTGGAGSAIFSLHDNGTLDYMVQVAGLSSECVGLTVELKPRRRNKRSVLYDLTAEYDKATGRAQGSWSRLEARHIHMLLQNELFINVATEHAQEGELRGQIRALLYSGLEAPRQELPTTLAGHFVAPPVRTGASGHAWVSVDQHCHLHYEIVVTGLSKTDDLAVNAHLHGLAEIGEIDDSSTAHKRLLTGFYGSQAQGVLKDISAELLRHLDQGMAFIQVSTKTNPRGEIRGRVHVSNNCESGTGAEEAELDDLLATDPGRLRKDPHTCFFENQHQAHGSRWTPNYDRCFSCSCRKRTVICDPVICPPPSCSRTVQPEDECCPRCGDSEEPNDMKVPERVEEHPEGCYFEGDQKMHAPGTTWHPFVPPFGYIKCAVCTCKGSSGEVHCEKVTCPLLTCSHPVRRNPSDCCKECPEEERPPPGLQHGDMMQADGPRNCKFGKNYYQNSDNWHPWVPLVGEMKCINCWCDNGATKCQRKQCPVLSCSGIARREAACCPECPDSREDDGLTMKAADKRGSWRH
ncbi:chordin-like [Spinachia spinachia]